MDKINKEQHNELIKIMSELIETIVMMRKKKIKRIEIIRE